MNFSRGTGFIELYIKTDSLSPTDWDILSDGLKWARKAFPTFNNVVMHGGSPQRNEVYGYTDWTENKAIFPYIILRKSHKAIISS